MNNILGFIRKNKKTLTNIGVLIVIGLAVYLLLPQLIAIENSWQVLLNLFPWAVAIAFLAQVLSYFGNGFLLQKTLEITRHVVSIFRSTLIVLGAASISLIAGGTVGSSAAIFQWTRGEKGSVGGSTLASLLPSLFNTLILVIFSIFGLIHLILVHDLSTIQFIGFSVTLLFLGVFIAIAIFASRYRKRASTAILWITRQLARLNKKYLDPQLVNIEVEKIFIAWDELWKGKWHLLILGAFFECVF